MRGVDIKSSSVEPANWPSFIVGKRLPRIFGKGSQTLHHHILLKIDNNEVAVEEKLIAQEIARSNLVAAINNLVKSPEEITTSVILQAVQSGDTEVCRLVTGAGHHLGVAIAHLVGALNIEKIIIAGSMARFGQPLLDAINEALRPWAMDQLVTETHVELSDLGQDIVMLGAASLVLSSELGVV